VARGLVSGLADRRSARRQTPPVPDSPERNKKTPGGGPRGSRASEPPQIPGHQGVPGRSEGPFEVRHGDREGRAGARGRFSAVHPQVAGPPGCSRPAPGLPPSPAAIRENRSRSTLNRRPPPGGFDVNRPPKPAVRAPKTRWLSQPTTARSRVPRGGPARAGGRGDPAGGRGGRPRGGPHLPGSASQGPLAARLMDRGMPREETPESPRTSAVPEETWRRKVGEALGPNGQRDPTRPVPPSRGEGCSGATRPGPWPQKELRKQRQRGPSWTLEVPAPGP